ncbi:MAG: UDP-3-O-(3-hydroxymyristoyl)glucosamine N-acyltransferase [Xanthobacteraceae bacterium]|jgi:UDP-3-O-[3-hydroxymyristoyl] glucosamine N-acyltransferase
MAEPMFFKHSDGLTVGEIVALTGAVPRDGMPLDHRITDVAPPDRAGPDDLIFLDKEKFAPDLVTTQAKVCLTRERLTHHVPPNILTLHCAEPYRAFVTVTRSLFPSSLRPSSLFEATGVASGAHVHSTARLENGVTIDPGAVIGPRAEIGARTVIAAGACVGPDVRIGRDCAIGAGAALINALIGDRVIIHSGARIGHDGYGFTPGPKGLQKIPQVGRVIVQDDVEIGTNTTIDRGGIRDTVIGEGSKIDNLVQIGHNVTIGRHCILAGHVGVSGSVTIGDYAVLGGKVGIADHVIIGEGASVTAGSGVMHDIGAGERWGGYPATTAREWMRGVAMLRRLLRHDRGKDSGGDGA